MKHIIILITTLFISFTLVAQESELMMKYRQMALDYNHDIKSAQENIAASMEVVGMAKSDLKPKLGANAAYQYTGNPIELNLNLQNNPLHIQGQNNQYGASVALSQPLYSGGKLMASLKKAELQQEYAENNSMLLTSVVSQQSDMTYWSSVARKEMTKVIEGSKQNVENLVKIVKQRVDVGYANPEDLLMTEVKLNEIEYQLQQAQTAYATSILSLNSLVGYSLNNHTEVEGEVVAITDVDNLTSIAPQTRPEQTMATKEVEIVKMDKKIVNSKYMPQLNIGAEGSYQCPAYDFNNQLKPNYGLYVKLSVPIFEWGKRSKESRAMRSKVNMAQQMLQKTDDKVNLEIATARLALSQAVSQVNLTANSLSKAFENEKKSTERYTEGKMSIVDLLQAQLYRQNAEINYIQAKLIAQNSWCELQYALNLYNNSGNY